MALTIANQPDGFNLFGTIPVQFANLTGDAAYPTGGYPVTGKQFGLGDGASTATSNGIRGIDVIGQNTASDLTSLVYNSQTGNVMLLAAGIEVANGTNVSTYTFNVIVFAYAE